MRTAIVLATLGMTLAGLLAGAAAQDSERKDEAGPSLEDLRRQVEQGSRGDSGSGPTLPSGSGASGGLLDALKGRPKSEPTGLTSKQPADVSGFGGGDAGALAPAPGATKPFFIDVLAPPQIVFNGVPPAPCVLPPATTQIGPPVSTMSPPGAPGNNQAYVCVSGAAFEAKSKIELRPAPSPYLRQISYAAGNPAQAVYLFTAPGPGKYRLIFEARMGAESQTKDVEIDVRSQDGASAKVHLEVVAPREIVVGERVAGCARVAFGQVPICITATSFDRLSQVVIEAPARRDIVRTSATPGNPAQAVFAFTPAGPGTYELPFGARLGNDLESKTVTIEVRAAGSGSSGSPSGSGGGGTGGLRPFGSRTEPTATGGGPSARENKEPTLRLDYTVERTRGAIVRVVAVDPDGDRVCVKPLNPQELAGPGVDRCGQGSVNAEYLVSDARVRRDPPAVEGINKLYEPGCKKVHLVFAVRDTRGASVSESIDVGINGLWFLRSVAGTRGTWELRHLVQC